LFNERGKIGGVDETLKMFPDLEAFVDAALEEIPRPKDEKKRKEKISTLVKRKGTL